MKCRPLCLLVLLLCLLHAPVLSSPAFGDPMVVTDVNEYVTLREQPGKRARELGHIPLGDTVVFLGEETEEGLLLVSWQGIRGYASGTYLKATPYEGEEIEVTDADRITLNLFLTIFAGQRFARDAAYTAESRTEGQLLDFAVEYLRIWEPDLVRETGEGGSVSEEKVPELCGRYLGKIPVLADSSRYSLRDGWFSWREDGLTKGGFGVCTRVRRINDHRILVDFAIYGDGEKWMPEGICLLTESRAAAIYPHSPVQRGVAVIDTGSKSPDAGWTLVHWAFR